MCTRVTKSRHRSSQRTDSEGKTDGKEFTITPAHQDQQQSQRCSRAWGGGVLCSVLVRVRVLGHDYDHVRAGADLEAATHQAAPDTLSNARLGCHLHSGARVRARTRARGPSLTPQQATPYR